MTAVAVVANVKKCKPALAGKLRSALVDAGFADVAWHEITKGSAARGAAKAAVEAGADVVVACGGDGTVRAASQALAGTDAALAVVPAGTANLFAGGHGLPTTPADVAALIAQGGRRVLDTGRCNGMTFNVMAGTGLDAAMIGRAEPDKERLGTLAYVRAGFHEAKASRPVGAVVTVDGEVFFEGPATCVLIGNLGELKGGLVAFPDASQNDGLLDVGILTADGRREWAGVIVSALRHRQDRSPHAHIGSGTEITVKLDSKRPFELDGGMKGKARKLRFDIEPASLHICSPAN